MWKNVDPLLFFWWDVVVGETAFGGVAPGSEPANPSHEMMFLDSDRR